MRYGMTTTNTKAPITYNPCSGFGSGSGGLPCAISSARKMMPVISTATPTNSKPTSERPRRLNPRITSAPHPVHTLAVSGTCVWQCGHTSVFTARQYTGHGSCTSEFFTLLLRPECSRLFHSYVESSGDTALELRESISPRSPATRAAAVADCVR